MVLYVWVHNITDVAIAFKCFQEGKMTIGGDDYYAELDYIEVMENAKEGYEEEAITPDEDNTTFQPGAKDYGKLIVEITVCKFCAQEKNCLRYFYLCSYVTSLPFFILYLTPGIQPTI